MPQYANEGLQIYLWIMKYRIEAFGRLVELGRLFPYRVTFWLTRTIDKSDEMMPNYEVWGCVMKRFEIPRIVIVRIVMIFVALIPPV